MGIKLVVKVTGTSDNVRYAYQEELEITWVLYRTVMTRGGWVDLNDFAHSNVLRLPIDLPSATVTFEVKRIGPNWISGFRLGGVKLVWASPPGRDIRFGQQPVVGQ